MPKYRRKLGVIEAEQFDPEHPADYIRHAADEYAVYNERHDSWIKLAPGDWVRTDKPGDRYPIDRKTFEATYEAVEATGAARNTSSPTEPLYVIHETVNWLGHYLARLEQAGQEKPEGGDYIYKLLLRSEVEHAGGIMHEHGRREEEAHHGAAPNPESDA